MNKNNRIQHKANCSKWLKSAWNSWAHLARWHLSAGCMHAEEMVSKEAKKTQTNKKQQKTTFIGKTIARLCVFSCSKGEREDSFPIYIFFYIVTNKHKKALVSLFLFICFRGWASTEISNIGQHNFTRITHSFVSFKAFKNHGENKSPWDGLGIWLH